MTTRSRVRLKDIAMDLHLSVVTVSRALQNRRDISTETRERVLQRVRELNYKPNLAARTLATGRTYSIGLVVPSFLHPFFAEVAKGIVDTIRPKGYGLLIASSNDDVEMEKRETEHLLARQVDALIVASVQHSPEFMQGIQARGSACVLVDRMLPGLRANHVGADDSEIGRIATQHLADQGCRRIAHIRGPEISTATGRLEGYQSVLKELGMPIAHEMIATAATADSGAEECGRSAMLQLLSLRPRPDGVFVFNDGLAVGAMGAILSAGLRIPRDIALVGCGNVRWAHQLRVPLSSVDQGAIKIGELAGRMALKLVVEKASPSIRDSLVPAKLVVRESSVRTRAVPNRH
ncbi:LacI family DNA-binding transcriptional regulator [uncultured Paludibaculum sp.]|uniref:LacI family DNA-binding transcriptional regulator n=1 Tax=uncultured Paludibaculum sp. TaxID=1765020 RepID=UPI002AABC4E7|nr:LacI family DNA-binding transcriptional regulator [uncultured Paludibaculum sp.]